VWGRSIELVYPPQVTPVRLMVLEAINSVGTALAEKTSVETGIRFRSR